MNYQQYYDRTISFHTRLFPRSQGQQYLVSEGITDAIMCERLDVGYCDGSMIDALPSEGKIIDDLKQCGILNSDGTERFKDMITFPVMDEDNTPLDIVGLTPDGKIITLTGKPQVWNLPATTAASEVIVADSIVEALKLIQQGKDNTVVMLNGARPSDYIDKPCRLPAGEDLSRNIIKSGIRCYELLDVDPVSGRLRATIRASKAGRLHVDTLNLYSASERTRLCRDLCRIFDDLPETMQADIAKIIRHCESRLDTAASPGMPAPMTEREKQDAEALGKSSDLMGDILADFETCGLVGEENNKLLCYLAMTSRKMDRPLSVLILSSSGAGKSALQDAALGFCPPEDVVKITSLSGKALFYKEQDSLKHKVLALEEGAGAEDASYAIRNLISADGLTTESTIRDTTSGKLKTMQNRVSGPTAVFCTTTDPNVDAETRSRFFVVGIDESREQTRRILQLQREQQKQGALQLNSQQQNTHHVHRNFQRLLRKLRVINPHADALDFTDDTLAARRIQPMYLQLINAIAFLRQMQKEILDHDGIEYVEVDEKDVVIGTALGKEILDKSTHELSIPARDLLDQLHGLTAIKLEQLSDDSLRPNDISFTRREVRSFTGWRKTRLHTHLKELLEHEYVVLQSRGSNSLQYYRLVPESSAPVVASGQVSELSGNSPVMKDLESGGRKWSGSGQ